MTNEELVKRFIDSKAVNFDTIGKPVTGLGPELLSASKTHINMVLIGRPCIIACMMMPAAEPPHWSVSSTAPGSPMPWRKPRADASMFSPA
jgi:hypothetical protein